MSIITISIPTIVKDGDLPVPGYPAASTVACILSVIVITIVLMTREGDTGRVTPIFIVDGRCEEPERVRKRRAR